MIRWLFYIEGALTMFVAIIAIFILPDFPATSRTWLSPEEVRLAEKRMEEDVGVGLAGVGVGVVRDALEELDVVVFSSSSSF